MQRERRGRGGVGCGKESGTISLHVTLLPSKCQRPYGLLLHKERGSEREQWGLCFRVRECSARACVCVCVTHFYSWTHLIISIETFRCVCVCESVCACRCDISKKLFVLHFDRQFANFLCSDASSASVAQLFCRTLPTSHPTPSRAEQSTLATRRRLADIWVQTPAMHSHSHTHKHIRLSARCRRFAWQFFMRITLPPSSSPSPSQPVR